MVDDPISEAATLFKSGYNCSQSVLAVFAEECGISKETALKIACPFGGGIGGLGKTCGALTGAIMVVGLKHGSTKTTDLDAKKVSNEKTRRLIETFEKNHGTTLCNNLVGLDIANLSGAEMMAQSAHFQRTCPKFLETVITYLEEEL